MENSGRKLLANPARPVEYRLCLEPSFDDDTFNGSVDILMETFKRIEKIKLNSSNLHPEAVSYSLAFSGETEESGEDHWSPAQYSCDLGEQTLTLQFPETIEAQTVFSIRVVFSGVLEENLAGLYKSSYTDDEGVKHVLATTHLQPNYARQVFPCFDEPALKACFVIEAVVPADLDCISNMPSEMKVKLPSGKHLVTFARTPKMSTYLVALVIGKLESIGSRASRVPINLYTPVGLSSQGSFALDIAVKGLRFFEEAFGCEYPLPKLDLVAVPDLAAGAMENWGLVIYRTAELLLDPDDSSVSRKKRIAETTFHEISHSWFGNLVTMDFWDGLWLNEGFATWMSWFAVDKFFPQWHVWQDYVADTLQSAMELDALRTTHPVQVKINDVADVGQVFDHISYKKGSSVLRMISKELGEETFLEGVQHYLQRHSFANATTEDLWDALEHASGAEVRRSMSIWTKEVGFPVVEVTEHERDGKLALTLKQRRYLSNQDDAGDDLPFSYPLRIVVRTTSGLRSLNLESEQSTLILDDPVFYKLNVDQNGFYRTAYSLERLQKFGAASKEGLLSVEDRVGIVADTSALCASGHQCTTGLLDLLLGMKDEPDYVVWVQITRSLKNVRSAWLFQPPEVTTALKTLSTDILLPKLTELGWAIDSDDDEILQQFKPLLFDAAGLAGEPTVISAAQEMFGKYASGDKDALHPALRDCTYGLVLANGGDEEFDAVWNLYVRATSEDEKWYALGNLGYVSTPHLVQRLVDRLLAPEIKDQDLFLPLWCLNTSVAGVEGIWGWARNNWGTIAEAQTPDLLRLIVPLILGGFSTEEQLAEAEAFFSQQDTKTFNQVLEQELEKIRARISWTKRDSANVRTWLEDRGYLANRSDS